MKEEYEVITGFWDRGQFRAIGDTVRMSEAEARAHVFAGCLKKKAEPASPDVRGGFEDASNAA